MSEQHQDPEVSPEAAYAAPGTNENPPAQASEVPVPKWGRFMLGMAVLGFGSVIGALFLSGLLRSEFFFGVAGAASVGAALFLIVQQGRLTVRTGKAGALGDAIGLGVLSAFCYALGAGVAVPFLLILFGRGRQPQRFGRSLLPSLGPDHRWNSLPMSPAVASETRAQLAAEWRSTGRTEHASVAAFARHTLDLLVVGAPPELLRNAQRDALDEIRHAELCFSLARALDGQPIGPAPFPGVQHAGGLPRVRTLALAKLAVTSLIDGALHEGVSARLLSATLKECDDPAIREMIREILRDEGRHAAHGWRVVEWCLAEGGRPVAMALRGAIRVLPNTAPSRLPDEALDGSWQHLGVPGLELQTRERAHGLADLVQRVRSLTAAA